MGGKRKNPWYFELWNMKYLKSFRWTHLNERLAYEQEMRKQRLRQEIALAKKEANFYVQNVEKSNFCSPFYFLFIRYSSLKMNSHLTLFNSVSSLIFHFNMQQNYILMKILPYFMFKYL